MLPDLIDNRTNENDVVNQDESDESSFLHRVNSSKSSQMSYGAIPQEDDINEGEEFDIEPDVLALPQVIRETVSLTDDPNIPVLTIRVLILAIIFIIPGALIDTINSYRTTSTVYLILFVQVMGHWVGKKWAQFIPNISIQFFGVKYNLNPGPWSIKETAILTIMAKSGATGNMATNALSMAEVHFGKKIHPFLAIGFMFSIVFIGYSYAIIAKGFVLYDPQYPWPQALMQTALLQSQDKADKEVESGSKQMKVFFIAIIGIAIWQLFPEFIFPLTSSLAVLCWMAPYDKTTNFLGSGMGGIGLLNFSLDWANITSSIMLYPYWIQVIQFAAFVFGAWILIPITKWGNVFEFKEGLMSNKLFLSNGSIYPTDELLTPDFQLNTTAYELYGPVHLGAQRSWNMFFDYAAYMSGIIWICLFGYDQLRTSLSRVRETYEDTDISSSSHGKYKDRLNRLYSNYEEVPHWWYFGLFVLSLICLANLYLTDNLFMPWWCVIVALMFGATIVTPLIWLYALSNFQLPIGTFNELLYGYMVENLPQKHGIGASFYGSLSGNAWYRAQHHLESMRLGFYNQVPPRSIFFAQIYGEVIGIPFNYIALRWVLDTKRDYISGDKIDPLHQWTGQEITSLHTNAVQYVILGPKRLFSNYPLLPYGFLAGLIVPMFVFILHSKYPNSKLEFNKWNTTVFFSGMSKFYGNLSTGYLSKFIGGTFTMFYAFRYKRNLWKQYNYILAAAFDTGLNLSILVIFILFSLDIQMPTWWGNDSRSVERCFALY